MANGRIALRSGLSGLPQKAEQLDAHTRDVFTWFPALQWNEQYDTPDTSSKAFGVDT